jgi:hypothetical protein
MIRIMGTFPVKTRLPKTAWVVAGLATLFSIVSSLVQFTASGGTTAMAEQAQYASVSHLLRFF